MDGGKDFLKKIQQAADEAQKVLPKPLRLLVLSREGVHFFKLIEKGTD